LRKITLTFTAIWILLVAVVFSLPYSEVVIQSCGTIRLYEYYIWKNGDNYQLVNILDNSVVETGSDFATLTNYAISLVGNMGGGTVYICEGEHIASQIITLADNVKLKGFTENPSNVVIRQGNSSLWYPGVIAIIDKSNVEVAYLTIDMQLSPLVNGSSWPPKGNGITFRDDDNNNGNIYIHHVRLLNIPCYGIKTHFGFNVTIHDVYFQNVWWDGMNIASTYARIENVSGTDWGDVGIALYHAKHSSIKNCHLYNCKEPPSGGSSGVYGFTMEGDPSVATNLTATNIVVENISNGYGFAVYGPSESIINNCTFIKSHKCELGGTNNTVMHCQFFNTRLDVKGVGHTVENCTINGSNLYLIDYPDSIQIIGNIIRNGNHGLRFLTNATNIMIKQNHIYCDTTPSVSDYAIDFGYGVTNINITVIQNDFTYNGTTNFIYDVLNLACSTNINLVIEDNIGYP
jgi:hypothetical protein